MPLLWRAPVAPSAASLNICCNRAFAAAKRVRTETAIGSNSVSIASVAVELARKIFGSLNGRTVFLVGAGKMSELAARHLVQQGAGAILVTNRTQERARQLAEPFNGRVIPFDKLYDAATEADIVISSTGAPHPIFRREHGQAFMQRRRNRPMFFIDIAVPRDVDPAMNKLEGIFVYDIDDLQAVAASHMAERSAQAADAEALIAAEVERFHQRRRTVNVAPAIVALQRRQKRFARPRLQRIQARLGSLSAEQIAAVEALTRGLVNKFLHPPMQALKQAARENDSARVEALCETWSLPFVPKSEKCRPHRLPPDSTRACTREARNSARERNQRSRWQMNLRIGSRGSQLALWQANHIAALLRGQGHTVEIEIIKTTGDRLQEVTFAQVGSKGMFTKEIEEALAEGRVDLAVHSLKDLPTELLEPFALAATPPRVDPRDVFVSVKYAGLAELPQGAVVGTSSQRRRAQLTRRCGPTLKPSSFAATSIRACASLPRARSTQSFWPLPALTGLRRRSGFASGSSRRISAPPPARGRLGSRRARTTPQPSAAIAFLDDAATRYAVTAERAALAALGGGCQVPIGIHCRIAPQDEAGEWNEIFGVVANPVTGEAIRIHHEVRRAETDPVALGRLAARSSSKPARPAARSRNTTVGRSLRLTHPLAGRRVLVTRAAHQAGKLSDGLRASGGRAGGSSGD